MKGERDERRKRERDERRDRERDERRDRERDEKRDRGIKGETDKGMKRERERGMKGEMSYEASKLLHIPEIPLSWQRTPLETATAAERLNELSHRAEAM